LRITHNLGPLFPSGLIINEFNDALIVTLQRALNAFVKHGQRAVKQGQAVDIDDCLNRTNAAWGYTNGWTKDVEPKRKKSKPWQARPFSETRAPFPTSVLTVQTQSHQYRPLRHIREIFCLLYCWKATWNPRMKQSNVPGRHVVSLHFISSHQCIIWPNLGKTSHLCSKQNAWCNRKWLEHCVHFFCILMKEKTLPSPQRLCQNYSVAQLHAWTFHVLKKGSWH